MADYPQRGADVAGIHACAAAMDAGRVGALLLTDRALNKRQQALAAQAEQAGIPLFRADATALVTVAPPGLRHQGAVAWLATEAVADTRSDAPHESELAAWVASAPAPARILVLDGIEDPRNLGACLRAADGAGVQLVLMPQARSAPLTAVARKTAAGAAESLPLCMVSNLARALEQLRSAGVWVVGLADEADQPLYATDLSGPIAIVMGNEGQGLRRLTRDLCDLTVSIPMLGSVSSLNVAVATGVVLYEVCRQSASGEG